RHRRGRPVPRHRAIHMWTSYALGAVWLVGAAAEGPLHKPLPGLLLVWTIGAGIPHWWHHRIRHVPTRTGDVRVAVWDELVACQGGALPDSRITGLEEATRADDHGKPKVIGWRAVIELPPGKLTSAQAISAVTRVASAYGKPATAVA